MISERGVRNGTLRVADGERDSGAFPQAVDNYNRRPNHVPDGLTPKRSSQRYTQRKSVCRLQKSHRRGAENSRKQIHDVLPDQKIEPPTRLSLKKLIGMPVQILERLGRERTGKGQGTALINE